MTYYEELGVPVGASADEIHHAYRQLSRLLHPDPQGDADLRRVAERQMVRLNDILSILSDEASRARYDASLTGAAATHHNTGPWIAAAAALAVVVWVAGTGGPGGTELRRTVLPDPPRRATSLSRPSRPSPAAASAISRQARRERTLHLERDLAAEPPPPVESAAPGPGPLPEPASLPPPNAPAPLGAPSPDLTLSGTWFYAAGASENARLPYPPEYIEAVIVERNGLVRGRYRARYRVRDRAISPVVSFAFEGDRRQPDAVLVWRGPAGARGEIHLRLVAGTLLEVSWSAEEMGSEMGLAAGRAVLTRAR